MRFPNIDRFIAQACRFIQAPASQKASKLISLCLRPYTAIRGLFLQSQHLGLLDRLWFLFRGAARLMTSTRLCCIPGGNYAVIIPREEFRLSYKFFSESQEGRKEMRHILGLLKRGDCLLDIGGFCGALSVFAKGLLREDIQVCCIEALPDNADRIRTIQLLNPAIPFQLLETVVSDSPGQIIPQTEADMMLRMGDANSIATGNYLVTSSLDSLCQQHSLNPTVIKIDVDGFELNVLYGAQNTLSIFKPRLWIEIHPNYLANQARSSNEIFDYLKLRGYHHEFFEDVHYSSADISHHAWFVHPDNP